MIDYSYFVLNYRKLQKDSQKRLRIGLVLGGSSGPLWVRDLIEILRTLPFFEVVPFVLAPGTAPMPPAAPWLPNRLYAWSRRKSDPFAGIRLDLPADVPILVIPRPASGVAQSLPDVARETLRAGKLDLLVWLPYETVPSGSCSDLASFGIFTVRLGDQPNGLPFWNEAVAQEPVCRVVVGWHTTSFERGRAVRTAEISMQHGWFFTRRAEAGAVAACRMLAVLGLEFSEDPASWKGRALAIPEEEWSIPRERVYPSTLESIKFMTRKASSRLRTWIEAQDPHPEWFIALRRDPSLHYPSLGRFSRSAFEPVPMAPRSRMADPFLATDKDKTWLFFEEIPAGSQKGRLSCMEIGGDPIGFSKPVVILEKDYHLSYPCVVPYKGDFFLLPESCAARVIQLFRATRFPFEWQWETTLMEDLAAVDTTPFFLDGRWYFFTTTMEPFMETLLFWSESLDGRWHLHPSSPISCSVRNCRSAGHLFYANGRLLRPTQDCSIRYGYGITINEVSRLTTTEFEERQVDFIPPDWRRGLLATHTLNSNGRFEVIDGARPRYRS